MSALYGGMSYSKLGNCQGNCTGDLSGAKGSVLYTHSIGGKYSKSGNYPGSCRGELSESQNKCPTLDSIGAGNVRGRGRGLWRETAEKDMLRLYGRLIRPSDLT